MNRELVGIAREASAGKCLCCRKTDNDRTYVSPIGALSFDALVDCYKGAGAQSRRRG